MSKAIKILKYILIILIIAILTGCASSKKNTYYAKKKKASKVNNEQVGRNKYYFSPGYQKKLNSTYKKK
jgi:PBP1b-binding outer membrane lipoprotein LpoB